MLYSLNFVEDQDKEVNDLKYWFAGYLLYVGKEADLAQRLLNDELSESDLFLIRGFCSKAPGVSEKEYIFTAITAG